MHLEKATPAHLDHFASWRAADRLERLTCRPVEEALDEVFASTNLNKLYCQTASFNTPSVRLLTALGFHLDGTLREHHELHGVLYDD